MATLTEREKLKNALSNKGVKDWTDADLDSFIERNRQSLQPLFTGQQVATPTTPDNIPSGFYNPATSRGFATQQPTTQRQTSLPSLEAMASGTAMAQQKSDKNALWDFTGNALWHGLDSASFGTLGLLDTKAGLGIEEALTEGGPQGSAGSIGAGLGGLAGFLVPFGAAKAATGAAVRTFAKGSVDDALRSLMRVGSKNAPSPMSVLRRRSPKYKKFSEQKQKEFFEPLEQTIRREIPKIHSKKAGEEFTKNWRGAVETSVREQLRHSGIKIRSEKSIKEIVDNIITTTGIQPGKGLPVSNLQQLIARSMGNGKFGEIAGYALEEGTLFALAESIPHVLHNLKENKEWDESMGGAMAHAFALGNVFGGLRIVPGGKDLRIVPSAFKRLKETIGKKKPYSAYDLTKEADRELLADWSIAVMKSADDVKGRKYKIFEELGLGKDDKVFINDADDIKRLVKRGLEKTGTEADKIAGARKLRDFLTNIEKQWNKNWWSEFIKEAGRDLYGSTPRMLMASAAMNFDTEVGFLPLRDDIPLADKVYHIALGAFMGKKGRALEYLDAKGKRQVAEWTGTNPISDKLKTMNGFLEILGANPNNVMLTGMLNDSYLRGKYIRPDMTNADITSLRDILVKEGVIIDKNTPHRDALNLEQTANNVIKDALRAETKRTVIEGKTVSYVEFQGKQFKSIEEMANWFLTPEGQQAARTEGYARMARRGKGIEGQHPVYEHLDYIGDRTFLKEGERIKSFDEVTTAQIRRIEKQLSDLNLESVESGITTVSDIDDIMLTASDVKMSSLVNVLKTSVKDLYKEITGSEAVIEGNIIHVSEIGRKGSTNPSSIQADIIDRYEATVKTLERIGVINVSKGALNTYTAENLANMENLYNKRIKKDLNLEINKSENNVDGFEINLGEAWVNQLVEGQAYYKSFRKMHDMLSDTEDSGYKNWESKEAGEEAFKLINKLMTDSNGLLVKEWKIIRENPDSNMRNMAILRSLRKMLEVMPEYRKNKTLEISYDVKAKEINQKDINDLKKELRKTGMNIFDQDPNHINNFTNDVANFALDKFVKKSSRININGSVAPFSATDKAKVAYLLDSGIADHSGNIIDLKLDDPFIAVLGNEKFREQLIKRSKSIEGNYVIGDFVGDKSAFRIQDMRADWQDALRKIFKEQLGMPEKEIDLHMSNKAAEILVKYEKHIKPYIKNAESPGGGIFQKTTAEGKITKEGLEEIIHHLDVLETLDNSRSHDVFVEAVDRQLNNVDMTRSSRKLLGMLYSRYYYGKLPSTRAITLMKKAGLYNSDKGVFTFEDLPDLSLEKRVQTAIKLINNTLPDGSNEAILSNRIREHMTELDKQYNVDTFKNITESDFAKKYHIDPILMKDASTYEPTIVNGKPVFDAIDNFIKSTKIEHKGKIVHFDDMPDVEKFKVLNDAHNLFLTKQSARNIGRLLVDEQAGVIIDSENVEMNNQLFTFMDRLMENESFMMLDTQVSTLRGLKDIRDDQAALSSYLEALSGSARGVQRKALNENALGESYETVGGHIPVVFGDIKWAIGIPDKAVVRDHIAKKFWEYVDAVESEYGKDVSYGKVISELKSLRETFIERTEVDKDLGEYSYEYKRQGAAEVVSASDMARMSHMVGDLFMYDRLGSKWVESLREGINDPHKVAKLIRRFKLMANTSNKTLSNELIDSSIKSYEGIYGALESTKEQADVVNTIQALQRLRKDGANIAIFEDEKGTFFSTYEQMKKQMDTEGFSKKEKEQHKKYIEDIREDASTVDSFMAVRPELWSALKALYGVGNVPGIGGMKPLISRLGAGKEGIMLGKTVFLPDERMQTFFDKNKDVDAVLVNSGEKLNSSDLKVLDAPFESWNDFANYEVPVVEGRKLYNNIEPKDISLGSVVNSDKKATLSYQLQNELTPEAANDFYNWMIAPAIENYNTKGRSKFSKHNPVEGIAFAKSLTAKRGGGLVGSYTKWVENNGIPFATPFLGTYKAQAKKHFIDDGILSLTNKRGTVSVLSPDMPDNPLRNTLFKFNESGTADMFTIGQVEIAHQNRGKEVKLDRMHIVKSMKGQKDLILTWEDFKKEIKGVKFKDERITKLGELYDVLETFVNPKMKDLTYEIAVAGWRPPSAKPSDKVVSGLRGFTDTSVGNQVRLNVADLMLRIEGDFDVDKYNYWWDTPTSVLREWQSNSNEVLAVAPEKPNRRLSVTSGKDKLDWFDSDSRINYNFNSSKAKKMVGILSKGKRLVQFLNTYNSHDGKTGLAIKPADKGMIGIVSDRTKMANRILADHIQKTVDSTVGFDNSLLNEGWLEKFLFGGLKDADGKAWDGLFAKYSGTKGVDGVYRYDAFTDPNNTHLKDPKDLIPRMMIMDAVNSYRAFLQLGSDLYDGGATKRVTYDDILNYSSTYSTRMKNINQGSYYRLLKRRPKDKNFDDWKNELDMYYKDKSIKKNWSNPFGSFGNNADLTNNEKMLPFDRAMLSIREMDAFHVDGPIKMFGNKLANFDKYYDQYSSDLDISQFNKNFMADVKKDVSNIGFINYLDYKIKKQTDSKFNAVKNGRQGLADVISEDIGNLKELRTSAEANLMQDKSVATFIRDAARKRVINDVYKKLHAPFANRKFKNIEAVTEWLKSKGGKAAISKEVQRKPFSIKGVNSHEHLDTIIWNEIFRKYKDIYIDPQSSIGSEKIIEFEKDIAKWKRNARSEWPDFFSDKKRRIKNNSWKDESAIMNIIEDSFNQMFSKWEGESQGLGRLILMKVMAPEIDRGSYSYINGRLTENFKSMSPTFVKFGLRWLANENNYTKSRISKNEADVMYKHIANTYNNYYKMFHGDAPKVDFSSESFIEQSKLALDNITGAESMPLRDLFGETVKGEFLRTEINDQLGSVFGYNHNETIGYIMTHNPMDPSIIKQMKLASNYNYMPSAFIPTDYGGGSLPHIMGYKSYNRAKENEARIFLGSSLKKGTLFHKTLPIANLIFEGSSDVRGYEKRSDLHSKVEDKKIGCRQ